MFVESEEVEVKRTKVGKGVVLADAFQLVLLTPQISRTVTALHQGLVSPTLDVYYDLIFYTLHFALLQSTYSHLVVVHIVSEFTILI